VQLNFSAIACAPRRAACVFPVPARIILYPALRRDDGSVPDVMCPAAPTCPQKIQSLPIFVDPAQADLSRKAMCSCRRVNHDRQRNQVVQLGRRVPMRSRPMVARSMHEFACTSTSSSSTTVPFAGFCGSCRRAASQTRIHLLRHYPILQNYSGCPQAQYSRTPTCA